MKTPVSPMQEHKPIIVALDFPDSGPLLRLLEQLDPAACRVKIGKELFTAYGPDLVREVVRRGFDVFLDLKFHDIPNTVAGAVRAAAALGVWMLNVHALGGAAMLRAARQAADSIDAPRRPLLIGVTLLTSLDGADLEALGMAPLEEQVLRLAGLCHGAGLDGVVCSAAEARLIRARLPKGSRPFHLITPGIRLPEDGADDQKRVLGPAEAIAAGSDYLVVGRPITRSRSPAEALARFNAEVAAAAQLAAGTAAEKK